MLTYSYNNFLENLDKSEHTGSSESYEDVSKEQQSDKNESHSKSSQSPFGLAIRNGIDYDQECLIEKCGKAIRRLTKLGLRMKQKIIKNELTIFARQNQQH